MPTTPPPVAAAASAGTKRTLMWLGAAAAVIVGGIGIVMVVSGDDDPAASPATSTSAPVVPATTLVDSASTTVSPPSTVAPTTVAATTTVAPTTAVTTAPATTVPPTTVPPTTAAPTTAAPATTAPPAPTGWLPSEFPAQAYPGVFEANLQGLVSPPIVDPAAPLPDGRYATTFVAQTPGSLMVDVHRFEACSVLGEPFCFPGPWAPDEIGVTQAIGTATLPLDTSLRAVVLGWECDEIVAEASGPELDELYSTLYIDYDAAFGPGLVAGLDPWVIVDQVRAAPVGGFGPPLLDCDDGYSLRWRFDDVPTLLVQWPFDWETDGWAEPASLLMPTMIEVDGANTTLYLYGGFFS